MYVHLGYLYGELIKLFPPSRGQGTTGFWRGESASEQPLYAEMIFVSLRTLARLLAANKDSAHTQKNPNMCAHLFFIQSAVQIHVAQEADLHSRVLFSRMPNCISLVLTWGRAGFYLLHS